MFFRVNNKIKKFAVICGIVLMLMTQFAARPFVDDTQAVMLNTTVIEDIPRDRETIVKGIWKTLTTAAMSSLISGVSMFTRKLAHETAVYLASADIGQGKLIYDKPFGQFMKDTLSSSAEDFIGEAVGAFGKGIGLDLCKIPNPKINLMLEIGMRDIFIPDQGGGPKPKCSFQELKDNWGFGDKSIGQILEERYGPGGKKFLAETFNASLKVTQSDFGVALTGIGKVDELQKISAEAKKLERMLGRGIKAVTNPISGKIESPAVSIERELQGLSAADQKMLTAGQIAGIYGSQLEQIPAYAASIFINAFASTLVKRVFTGLFDDTPDPSANNINSDISGSFFAQDVQNNREYARKAFSFLMTPSIAQISNYDILSEFAACPDRPGLNNCVIDSSFLQAIKGYGQGSEPLTIREAMKPEMNLLHANWQLISPRHGLNDDVKNCYINNYCYSNIQKLRKARILPLGFEIAALKSDPDRPWTLGEVVAGFNDCNSQGQADLQHPFCHLIDPNWVLKAPQAKCDSKVIGPELISPDGPQRREECVDLKTCILEEDDGICGQWGYCTREKNVWVLGGKSCPAYYNTCTTYTNLEDRSEVSYLSRTIDYGECSADSVGCRAYASEKTGNDWMSPQQISGALKGLGRAQILYFNRNAKSCDADGCSQFFSARRINGQFVKFDNNGDIDIANGAYQKNMDEPVFLRKAPDYLGCYDTERGPTEPEPNVSQNSPGIEWPQTITEVLNDLPSDARCNDYARACAPSEVNCEEFTPVNGGGESVPAIAGPENACDQSCVGYETFKQEASDFEAEEFPLYFIPQDALDDMSSNGLVCNENYEGCDEFTNIEISTEGGEDLRYFSHIRYCEKPNGANEKTFFSWQGSDSEGYVLRTHKLLQIDDSEYEYISRLAGPTMPQANRLSFNFGNNESVNDIYPVGSPAYNDDTLASLQDKYNKCNSELYAVSVNTPYAAVRAEPDCRALYDSNGNIYYRLLSDTVTVSEQCVRFRKTDSKMYIDQALTDSILADTGLSAQERGNACARLGGLWGDATGDGNNECQRCFAGGIYENGVCVYRAIPGEATECPAAANKCRAYTGNAGNNINPNVILDSFEPVADSNGGASQEALNEAKKNWTDDNDVKIAAEALRVSQNSLQVDIDIVERNIPVGSTGLGDNVSLNQGAWYELSFWARGVSQNLDIYFVQDDGGGSDSIVGRFTSINLDMDSSAVTPLSIGAEWREYRVGPARFAGDSSKPVRIRFARFFASGGTSGRYFLDHVRLGQLEDKIYLIKNSWQREVNYQGNTVTADVGLACDSNPADIFPGSALGCRAYDDSRNNRYFITGFSSLCREEAVGCQPLFETYNNSDTESVAYNIWCQGGWSTSDIRTELDGSNTCSLIARSDDRILGRCQIPRGGIGCYIEGKTILGDMPLDSLPSGMVVTSTVFIPADPDTPIYLVNREEYQCDKSQKGCMALGLQNQIIPNSTAAGAYEYDLNFIINDPDEYARDNNPDVKPILCREELLSCAEFQSGANKVYFKDPKYIGGATCSYRSQRAGGAARAGWFKDGVGKCLGGVNHNKLCRSNDDCGEGGKCQGIGTIPCYENYLKGDNTYGIWSNRSADYAGFVGVCDADNNACSELVDHLDTSSKYPEGRPYYRIYPDQDLTGRQKECEGRVSLKEGCVLFDKTDEPNKKWSTSLTYAASERANPRYGFVDPVSAGAGGANDANLLLKVRRDRACAEWLACRSSVTKIDDDGRHTQLCSMYKACDDTVPGQECLNYVERPLEYRFLDEAKYTGRDVSWFGKDYSGYSLYNKYQITDYAYIRFDGDDNLYLAYEEDNRFFSSVGGVDYSSFGCAQNSDGARCGIDGNGRCYNKKCLYPISGAVKDNIFDDPEEVSPNASPEEQIRITRNNITKIRDKLSAPSCKGFPELDSPFPESLAEDRALVEVGADGLPIPNSGAAGNVMRLREGVNQSIDSARLLAERRRFLSPNVLYKKANFCQDGNCSCSYNKLQYGGIVDYFSVSTTLDYVRPKGVCGAGARAGFPCEKDSDCSAPFGALPNAANTVYSGVCQKLDRKETHIGLTGFCLEPDYSHPIGGRSGIGGKQKYACLTWLPIQISVNNGDLLNSSREAGYLPDAQWDGENDSAPSGELYCVSTDRDGWYDASAFPANFDNSNGNNFQTMFNNAFAVGNNGFKDFRDELERRCYYTKIRVIPNTDPPVFEYSVVSPPAPNINQLYDSNIKKDYASAFCPAYTRGIISNTPRDITRTKLAAQILQVYAWRRLGYNAHVAWIDNPPYVSPLVDNFLGAGLNIRDISRIYIVPVSYSDGSFGGFNTKPYPQFLNDKYFINIARLASFQNDFGETNDVDGTLSNLNGWVGYIGRPDSNGNYNTAVYRANFLQTYRGNNSRLVDGVMSLCTSTGVDSIAGCDRNGNDHPNEVGWFFQWQYRQTLDNGNVRYAWVFVPKTKNRDDLPMGEVSITMPDYFNQINMNSDDLQLNDGLDPFSGARLNNCDGTVGKAFDFDAAGNLVDVHTKGCVDPDFHTNLAVIVVFKDKCTEYMQVYKDQGINPLTEITNKAWTNRVWANARNDDFSPYPHPFGSYGSMNAFNVGTTRRPFGSLPLPGSLLDDPNEENSQNVLLDYDLYDPTNHQENGETIPGNGIPYTCKGMLYNGQNNVNSVNFKDLYQCSFLRWSGYSDNSKLYPRMRAVLNSVDLIDAGRALRQLFALSFKNARLNQNRVSYSVNEEADISGVIEIAQKFGESISAEEPDEMQAPRVFSLNPATCYGNSNHCTAAESDNISINKRNQVGAPGSGFDLRDYDGNGIFDEDLDADAYPDPIIKRNTQHVTMNFFAFADDNRMPIRQVVVDWGDGYMTNDMVRGLYKNRKPFCDNDNNLSSPKVGLCLDYGRDGVLPATKSTVTCNSDDDCPDELAPNSPLGDQCILPGQNGNKAPRFGNAPRACVEEPFEFTHDYVCSRTVANMPSNERPDYVKRVDNGALPDKVRGILRNNYGLLDSNLVCVFKPRVHIRDNWDYCNGRCPGGSEADNLCYGQECDYTNPPDGAYPWTDYKGLIVVIPPEPE